MLKLEKFSVKSRQTLKTGKAGQDFLLLKDVSFEVGDQEIHCILGKNGSGKTTLAYAIMGLDRYEQVGGTISLNNQDIAQLQTDERARAGITIAFQEPARFEGLTVRDFLSIGLRRKNNQSINNTANVSKVAHPDAEVEMKKIFKLVGLEDKFLDRKLDEKLSGGERKRIELASVIMMRPKLMILDEPDASLDIIVYNELYDLMLNIRKELGCSILLITHREEAGMIADKATLIDQGQVIKTGRFRTVMHEYCRRMGARERCLVTKKLS